MECQGLTSVDVDTDIQRDLESTTTKTPTRIIVKNTDLQDLEELIKSAIKNSSAEENDGLTPQQQLQKFEPWKANVRPADCEMDDDVRPKMRKFDHLDYQKTNDNSNFLIPHSQETSGGVSKFSDLVAAESLNSFPCQAPGCVRHFESMKDYDEHYSTKHSHVCCACKKLFPSDHLLGLHVQETHDSFFKVRAAKQPMFECYLETCKLKFNVTEERFKHCVDDHGFPKRFQHSTSIINVYPRFPPRDPDKQKAKSRKGSKKTNAMETEMTDNSSIESAAVTDIHESMDLSNSSAATNETESKPAKPSGKKSGGGQKSNTHITFGHSTAARFVPRCKFAMGKNQKTISKQNTESMMDLTEVRTSLQDCGVDGEPEPQKNSQP